MARLFYGRHHILLLGNLESRLRKHVPLGTLYEMGIYNKFTRNVDDLLTRKERTILYDAAIKQIEDFLHEGAKILLLHSDSDGKFRRKECKAVLDFLQSYSVSINTLFSESNHRYLLRHLQPLIDGL